MINDSNIIMIKLVKKILGRAVLDFACLQTVAGEIQFNVFLDTLIDQGKWQVKTAKSNRIFYFRGGDGGKRY